MVDISLSSLTDEGVRHLSNLPALDDLNLEGKKFTDQSLLHLSRAKALESLVLRMDVSEISDEGLKYLEGLSNLRRLHLQKSKLSNEAKGATLEGDSGSGDRPLRGDFERECQCRRFTNTVCPVARALEVAGDRWTLLILDHPLERHPAAAPVRALDGEPIPEEQGCFRSARTIPRSR